MELPTDYGALSPQERREVREEYQRMQTNKCYHCKNPLDGPPTEAVLNKRVDRDLFPKGFFLHPVHLHHSHEDGKTIGVVHSYCNAVLWQYYGE